MSSEHGKCCHTCRQVYQEFFKCCGECGEALQQWNNEKVCPKCGIVKGGRYCSEDGSRLEEFKLPGNIISWGNWEILLIAQLFLRSG